MVYTVYMVLFLLNTFNMSHLLIVELESLELNFLFFFCSLQAIHIHNNHLTSLPEEIVSLHKLFILVLAFNRFVSLPPVVAQMTNVRVSEVENIIMAGIRLKKFHQKR